MGQQVLALVEWLSLLRSPKFTNLGQVECTLKDHLFSQQCHDTGDPEGYAAQSKSLMSLSPSPFYSAQVTTYTLGS